MQSKSQRNCPTICKAIYMFMQIRYCRYSNFEELASKTEGAEDCT